MAQRVKHLLHCINSNIIFKSFKFKSKCSTNRVLCELLACTARVPTAFAIDIAKLCYKYLHICFDVYYQKCDHG